MGSFDRLEGAGLSGAGSTVIGSRASVQARAMVDTWSHSYFRTPGLRVLYVVPRASSA